MSLLRRVEAQRERAAREAGLVSGTAPAKSTPETAQPPAAPPPAPPPVLVASTAVPTNAARESLIHQVRLGLQGEIGEMSSSLLEAPVSDVRPIIDGVVGRFLQVNG